MAVVHLMVGLPAVGKTTRARVLEADRRALRLTPDDWMAPLFGESGDGGVRDVMEGRLITTGLRVLRLGVDVVLDFGFWSRDERTAVRWLAAAVGAGSRVEFLSVDPAEQRRRVLDRWERLPHTTFEMSDDDLASYRLRFTPPADDELTGGALDPVPHGWSDWGAWAADRWPSLVVPG